MSTTIERSPADVLRLVVAAAAALALAVGHALFGATLVGFAADVLRGLDALPSWLATAVLVGVRVLSAVVLAIVLVVAFGGHRWRMLLTVATGGVTGALLGSLWASGVPGGEGTAPLGAGDGFGPLGEPGAPGMVGLAAVTAVLTAAAPWLGRRTRRVGTLLVLGLVVTAFVSAPVSARPLLGAVVGWLAGSAVLVAAGAPSRRPTAAAVAAGLAAVGVPVATLERAGVDARGSTPYFAVAPDGTRLFVKALGADERSADLLFRLYRRLRPHDLGDERPFATLRRAVEHEAFLALLARRLGVPTPAVRAVAAADPNGHVLAYDAIAGRSLDRLTAAELDDDVLRAAWAHVAVLRAHRVAHRDLRLANVFVGDDGAVHLIDFGFAEAAASDLLLATDVAELIASSGAVVGVERAVAHAAASVDAVTLRRAATRLQRWALSGATRAALASQRGVLDALRAATEAAARAA
jgi:undecaprenyl-diphosphatase